MGNKKIGKALNKANKEKIPYVIIIGEDELTNNYITIKNMTTGKERKLSFIFNWFFEI